MYPLEREGTQTTKAEKDQKVSISATGTRKLGIIFSISASCLLNEGEGIIFWQVCPTFLTAGIMAEGGINSLITPSAQQARPPGVRERVLLEVAHTEGYDLRGEGGNKPQVSLWPTHSGGGSQVYLTLPLFTNLSLQVQSNRKGN